METEQENICALALPSVRKKETKSHAGKDALCLLQDLRVGQSRFLDKIGLGASEPIIDDDLTAALIVTLRIVTRRVSEEERRFPR